MKELFTKTSTTSIIAVLIMVMGFALLFAISFLPTQIDAALRTQIVQGDWQIMTVAVLYYFGQSKTRPAQANTDSGDINVNPPVL